MNLKGNLDLTGCTHLEYIYCDDNSIESLILPNCQKLKELSIKNNKISSLDLNDFAELTKLYCDNNIISQLDLRFCTKLNHLSTANNNLTFMGFRLPIGVAPTPF